MMTNPKYTHIYMLTTTRLAIPGFLIGLTLVPISVVFGESLSNLAVIGQNKPIREQLSPAGMSCSLIGSFCSCRAAIFPSCVKPWLVTLMRRCEVFKEVPVYQHLVGETMRPIGVKTSNVHTVRCNCTNITSVL